MVASIISKANYSAPVYLLVVEKTLGGGHRAHVQDHAGTWFHQTDEFIHAVSAELKAVRAVVCHNGGYGFKLVDCSPDEG